MATLNPLSWFRGPTKAAPVRSTAGARPVGQVVRARYDAAQTTDENKRHWAWADSQSAKAANSLAVRHQLRNRARYETQNNSYAQGIVWTLANDTVGTGPRLQLLTEDESLNRAIEAAFAEWAGAINLASKLWAMRCAQIVDGETFGLFITNPRLNTDVRLDVKLIEADQVTTPFLNPTDPYAVDGIEHDPAFNPIKYSMLRYHPGDLVQLGFIVDWYDASQVIHWFRETRPNQFRGIPDLTPALPLFAQLRRYTLAVLAAAETAADFAAVLYSELPADAEGSDAEPFEKLEIDRRMMTTLPAGWKMSQFKPEQPVTTYEMFKSQILNEIGRCLNLPFNVVAGNSSNYNYASGRLDHQVYHKSLRCDRRLMEVHILDRILAAWAAEMTAATDVIPPGLLDARGNVPHRWFWDGQEHVDPEKEANATKTRLETNTTTLADEYARSGRDWEAQLRQRARELELMRELGMTPAQAAPAPAPTPDAAPARPAPAPTDDTDSGEDDE